MDYIISAVRKRIHVIEENCSWNYLQVQMGDQSLKMTPDKKHWRHCNTTSTLVSFSVPIFSPCVGLNIHIFIKKVSPQAAKTFHAKQCKKINWREHFFMERKSLDKNADQPCLASCCRRAQGAKKWPVLSQESEWALCVSLTMAFATLPAHSFLHSLICRKGALQAEEASDSLQQFLRRGFITRKSKPQQLSGWSQLGNTHKGKEHRDI